MKELIDIIIPALLGAFAGCLIVVLASLCPLRIFHLGGAQMTKPKFRIWHANRFHSEWLVQHKPGWSPIWWTVGQFNSPQAARGAMKELEQTE